MLRGGQFEVAATIRREGKLYPALARGNLAVEQEQRIRVVVTEAQVRGSDFPPGLIESELAKLNPVLDFSKWPFNLRIQRLMKLYFWLWVRVAVGLTLKLAASSLSTRASGTPAPPPIPPRSHPHEPEGPASGCPNPIIGRSRDGVGGVGEGDRSHHLRRLLRITALGSLPHSYLKTQGAAGRP